MSVGVTSSNAPTDQKISARPSGADIAFYECTPLGICAIDHLPRDLIHFLWREREIADLITLSSKPYLLALQLLEYLDVVLEPARRADVPINQLTKFLPEKFSIGGQIQLLFRGEQKG